MIRTINKHSGKYKFNVLQKCKMLDKLMWLYIVDSGFTGRNCVYRKELYTLGYCTKYTHPVKTLDTYF